jgi:hypothetical protein
MKAILERDSIRKKADSTPPWELTTKGCLWRQPLVVYGLDVSSQERATANSLPVARSCCERARFTARPTGQQRVKRRFTAARNSILKGTARMHEADYIILAICIPLTSVRAS